MQPIINVHCHLLNFAFVPDAFFNANVPIRLRSRAPFREWLLRRRTTSWLARATVLLPGVKYGRLHEVLHLLRQDIHQVAEGLDREMRLEGLNEAEIVLATPLMMDLEAASFGVAAEYPYRYQVKLVSQIAAEFPCRIMPFIMFDPRREGASELVVTALEQMGFLGVKMYPPLGYHPDPASILNEPAANRELAVVYQYCEAHGVPITAHCSKGGAYIGELLRCRRLVHELAGPSSWEPVLQKHPELRLNFAHFGGKDAKPPKFFNAHDANSWCCAIFRLMEQYPNVYADLSYHDSALKSRTAPDYFQSLHGLLDSDRVRGRVLFGTDWPMISHTWTEKDYVKAFLQLPSAMFRQIAFENPIDFLFPNRQLQPRLARFFRSQNVDEAALPRWIPHRLALS